MKRIPTDELLDSDSGTPEELAASIQDLLRINRWFGGISSHVAMLGSVCARLNRDRLSVLDVASGSGAVSKRVTDLLAQEGLKITVTLMDRAQSHLGNHFPCVAGDALALPFADGSFDVVSSNLFVHHLSPSQVFQFAKEGLRVSRVAFLIHDLIRSPVHLAMAYAGLPLFRSRITWHDAPASVRQAYTPREMRGMLGLFPDTSLEISSHYLYRMNVALWKLHA